VLGGLICNPVVLRVADIGEHPRSFGCRFGDRPMRTLLGVPVLVAGEALDNLSLIGKQGGELAKDDEVALLAEFDRLAINRARRYSGSEARCREVHRTVDATMIGGSGRGVDPPVALDLAHALVLLVASPARVWLTFRPPPPRGAPARPISTGSNPRDVVARQTTLVRRCDGGLGLWRLVVADQRMHALGRVARCFGGDLARTRAVASNAANVWRSVRSQRCGRAGGGPVGRAGARIPAPRARLRRARRVRRRSRLVLAASARFGLCS
jgi:hypothetical protein